MGTERIEGQVVSTGQQMGLASIPQYINHYVGPGPHVLTDPAESDPDNNASRYMMINIEKGSFRMQVGDTSATIGAYAAPTSDVTNGSGTLALEEFEIYVFTSPDQFTLVGSAGDSVITVAWL